MEIKHTLGPWTADTDKKNYGTDDINPIFIHGADGEVLICEMNHRQRKETSQPTNVEADARLIVAAPDLLTACEEALWLLEADASEVSYQHRVDILDSLKAAIIKATSEAAADGTLRKG
jgi:hypothetical protein